MVFTGFYEHQIDPKNRLAIPAKHRSQIDPERDGAGFYLVPGQPADSLWLYTPCRFEQLVDRADSSLIPDDDQLRFDQVFFTLAEHVECDTQGRILLPERMLRQAGIGREVVICGVRDHLEIRRRDDFDKELQRNWQQYRELQMKARDAYSQRRRQPGPEAGQS
jgi:MraZ protein